MSTRPKQFAIRNTRRAVEEYDGAKFEHVVESLVGLRKGQTINVLSDGMGRVWRRNNNDVYDRHVLISVVRDAERNLLS